MKRQATERQVVFANYTPDEGFISTIYKELIKLNAQTPQTIQFKNGQKLKVFPLYQEQDKGVHSHHSY